MAECRLCGYTARLDKKATAQEQEQQVSCLVCGEEFGGDSGRRNGGALQQAALLAQAGGQTSQLPVPAMGRWVSAQVHPSGWLNSELRSLLDLVPKQQDRRQRAKDVVRAIGNHSPVRVEKGPGDPEVVFIRPRVDPTMRALKGRYKTQPREGRATSMSALHRLSHPLIGYDSMKALAPKARRRRQESAERVLERGFARGDASGKGRAAQYFNRTHSSAELSRHSARNARLRRRSSGSSSSRINALHLQRRNSAAPTVNDTNTGDSSLRGRRQRCGDGGGDEARFKRATSCQSSRRSLGSPASMFRLRASGGGRRTKPILRRKRVATMRSVNGWVREADPASVTRQAPLDRRVLALGRTDVEGGGSTVAKRDGRRAGGNDGVGRFSGEGGDATFLTALDADADGGVPFDDNRCCRNGQPANRVAEAVVRKKSDNRRPRDGVGRVVVSVQSKREQQQRQQQQQQQQQQQHKIARMAPRLRRRSSSAETLNRRRKSGVAVDEILRKARGKVEVMRGTSGTQSCGAFARPVRSREAMPAGSVDTETGRLEQGMLRRWGTTLEDAVSQSARSLEGYHVGLPRTRGTGGDGPTDPKARKASVRRRVGDGLVAPGKTLLEATSPVGKSTAQTAEIGMAPAWDAPGLHPATPLRGENRTKVQHQNGDGSVSTDRSRSPWRRLRESADPTAQSVVTLQSFENKFAPAATTPPPPADEPLRKETGKEEEEEEGSSRTQQLLLNDDDARRRRWEQEKRLQQASSPAAGSRLAGISHRPLSREWVQRRSLPSLLTADANASPSTPLNPSNPSNPLHTPYPSYPLNPSTPPPPTLSSRAAVATRRRRGKASSGGQSEPTGRMQRLDKTATTVADAWGGGGALAARHRNRGAESSVAVGAAAVAAAGVRKPSPAALAAARLESVAARGGVGIEHNRAVCGTSSGGGDLLSSAVLEPLLYVGNGGGFRLRSF